MSGGGGGGAGSGRAGPGRGGGETLPTSRRFPPLSPHIPGSTGDKPPGGDRGGGTAAGGTRTRTTSTLETEKRVSEEPGGRQIELTYIIFVYRFWEACHLNEGADLGETSQTRTIKAIFLEGLNQSARSRTDFSSCCGSVGSLRWCERSFLSRFRLFVTYNGCF